MPENSHRYPDRESQSLTGLIKQSVWRTASPIGQARLQLDSGSKGSPKNSTSDESRHFYESCVLLCVWEVNTPLHCFSGKREKP